jgi:hypothetical protein
MHGEGFEPSHLTIVGLKSTALDHSAIRAISTFAICWFQLFLNFIFGLIAVWNHSYLIPYPHII